MLSKYKQSLILTLIVFFSFIFNISAQTATPGTAVLSINPTSFTLSSVGSKTTLSVIYTGTPTDVAEIHFTLGSGLKINSFTPGTGISFLYSSTTTNEVHLGNIQDDFSSGQSLLTFEVEATSANQSGQVGFNSSQTFVPNVTATYTGSSYTIGTGTGTTTITPIISGSIIPVTTSYTPTTLPKTSGSNEYTYVFLSSVSLFGLGFIVWVSLAKARIRDKEEDIKIISIE